jgi:hypothetical protein
MKYKLHLYAHRFGCRWSTAPTHFFSMGSPASSLPDGVKRVTDAF